LPSAEGSSPAFSSAPPTGGGPSVSSTPAPGTSSASPPPRRPLVATGWSRVVLRGVGAQATAAAVAGTDALLGGSTLGPDGEGQATVWTLPLEGKAQYQQVLESGPSVTPAGGVGELTTSGQAILALEGGGGSHAWLRDLNRQWHLLSLPPALTLAASAASPSGNGWVALGEMGQQVVVATISQDGAVTTHDTTGLAGATAAPNTLSSLGERLVSVGGSPGFSAVSDPGYMSWQVSTQLRSQEESRAAALGDGTLCAVGAGTFSSIPPGYVSRDGLTWSAGAGSGPPLSGRISSIAAAGTGVLAFGEGAGGRISVWGSSDCASWQALGPPEAPASTIPVVGASADWGAVVVGATNGENVAWVTRL